MGPDFLLWSLWGDVSVRTLLKIWDRSRVQDRGKTAYKVETLFIASFYPDTAYSLLPACSAGGPFGPERRATYV